MGVVTIYRLSESCFNLIEGGSPAVASSISFNELKIACGNVINQLLKVEHFQGNERMGEKIPNGSVLGWYESISGISWNNKSKFLLPIKPLKLPRNMGVFGVYPKYTDLGDYELDKEWIPAQMGQTGLLKSQPLISNLLGQIFYENIGLDIISNIDVVSLFPNMRLAFRLAIMDISQYDDYEPLPILPEHEWSVIQQVYQMYIGQPIPDKVVEATVKEIKNVPLNQQRQS